VCRCYERNWPKFRREENVAAPLLRKAVINAIHCARPNLVVLFQGCYEVLVNLVFGHIGYVFHGDQFGPQSFDEALEGIQKRPFPVRPGVATLVIAREGLTGSATRQQLETGRTVPRCNFLNGNVFDALRYESRTVIPLVGILAIQINVITCMHVNTGLAEPSGQSTCAT